MIFSKIRYLMDRCLELGIPDSERVQYKIFTEEYNVDMAKIPNFTPCVIPGGKITYPAAIRANGKILKKNWDALKQNGVR